VVIVVVEVGPIVVDVVGEEEEVVVIGGVGVVAVVVFELAVSKLLIYK
jgi:hypothetical protein